MLFILLRIHFFPPSSLFSTFKRPTETKQKFHPKKICDYNFSIKTNKKQKRERENVFRRRGEQDGKTFESFFPFLFLKNQVELQT